MPEPSQLPTTEQVADQTPQPFQPRIEFQLIAVQEELAVATNNKLYLLAVIKDIEARHNGLINEFHEAQEMWGLERQSLLARIAELQGQPTATDGEEKVQEGEQS